MGFFGGVCKNPHIEREAANFGLDPALLAGVLMTEIMWDYDIQDEIESVGTYLPCSLSVELPIGSPGYASVHRGSFYRAMNHCVDEEFLSQPETYDPCYAYTRQGAVRYAAIITRHLVDTFSEDDNLTVEQMAHMFSGYRELDSRYESFDEFQDHLDSNELTNNGQLALPFMRYTREIWP